MAIVCSCERVSDRVIRRAIDAGAHSVEAVAARCGAGGCCLGCHPTIERLLDECLVGTPIRRLARS